MENWFTDQIRNRQELDDTIFEKANESMDREANGQRSEKTVLRKTRSNREALDCFLKLYQIKEDSLTLLDQEDILYRVVSLEDTTWWKESGEPFLVIEEHQEPVILIPGTFSGYYYWDQNHHRVRITAETAKRFHTAYQFSRPMPEHAIFLPDFLRYMAGLLNGADFLLYLLLSLGAVLLGLVVPKMTYLLLQSGTHDVGFYSSALLIMASAVICSHILQSNTGLLYKRMVQRVTTNVIHAILIRVMRMDVEQRKKLTAGDLWKITCVLFDFCDKLILAVLQSGVSLGFIVAYFGQMMVYMKSQVLFCVIVFVFQILYSLFLLGRIQTYEYAKRRKMFDEENFLLSCMEGIHKIKQCHAEKRVYGRWADQYIEIASEQKKASEYTRKLEGISNLTGAVLTFFIIGIAVWKQMDRVDFLVLTMLSSLLLSRAGLLANQLLALVSCRSYWKSMDSVLKTDHFLQEQGIQLKGFSGNVSAEHVTFSYDDSDRKVLDNISFEIKRNEYVAIVGKSGSGKSTLLRILLGSLKPSQGKISYGKWNLSKVNRRSVLKHISVIMQDDVLIPGTLRENMQLHAGNVSDQEIWDALERASIADVVRSLPLQLETMVQSHQEALSKGQIQRLLIARAIVSKPKMLIFDEATSALDNLSQKKIKNTLDEIACTKIIVAHRLSTVRECDRILVLDNGKIVEEGNYQSLMERQGLFCELVRRQEIDSAEKKETI